jgi:DNA-binding transcriptional ArsR family regulator
MLCILLARRNPDIRDHPYFDPYLCRMTHQTVELRALRAAVVAPVLSPLPTLVALLGDPARIGLRGRYAAALAPLRTVRRSDGAGGRPNELVPVLPGATLDEHLDAVAAVEPEQLAHNIDAALSAGHPAGPWRGVAADPARWLRTYVSALRRAWTVVEPLWARSAGLLDREVERVSVALARGAGPELIAERFPASRLNGDELLLPSHTDGPGRVGVGGALMLQPLLAPAPASGWTDDYADTCLAIRYSIPHAWRAFDGASPGPASLAALVGVHRAQILRHLERGSATAGELAELLHGVPSMASHHVRALESAGLVTRERDGRHVRVHRTARGTELIALYPA